MIENFSSEFAKKLKLDSKLKKN